MRTNFKKCRKPRRGKGLRQGVKKGRPRRSRKNRRRLCRRRQRLVSRRLFPALKRYAWVERGARRTAETLASHWALALPVGHLETTGPRVLLSDHYKRQKNHMPDGPGKCVSTYVAGLFFYKTPTKPTPNKNSPIAFTFTDQNPLGVQIQHPVTSVRRKAVTTTFRSFAPYQLIIFQGY